MGKRGKPHALILAAGSARRFGRDKRLYSIDGVPMLGRTLNVYRLVFDAVSVVVRPGESTIGDLARSAGCAVIEAADAERGQARSLAAGVAAMTDAPSLVIGLGDMPFVTAATLQALVAKMAIYRDAIVRPRHDTQPGNPIGFPPSTYAALTRIDGDTGARQIVAASDKVRFLDVDDPGVVIDIDRPGPA